MSTSNIPQLPLSSSAATNGTITPRTPKDISPNVPKFMRPFEILKRKLRSSPRVSQLPESPRSPTESPRSPSESPRSPSESPRSSNNSSPTRSPRVRTSRISKDTESPYLPTPTESDNK